MRAQFIRILAGFTLGMGLLSIVACSPVPAEPGNGTVARASQRCLSAPIETTQVLDDKTLFVQDRSGTAALIRMRSACLGSPHDAVGFTFRGADQICHPNDADITGQVTTIGLPCFVGSIELLSKESANTYKNGAPATKTW